MPNNEEKRIELRRAALEYHEFPTPGKRSEERRVGKEC